MRLVRCVWPSFTLPFTLPTALARGLVFKLVRDVHNIPSLLELVKLMMRVSSLYIIWRRMLCLCACRSCCGEGGLGSGADEV